jgi:hypothetical protein
MAEGELCLVQTAPSDRGECPVTGTGGIVHVTDDGFRIAIESNSCLLLR